MTGDFWLGMTLGVLLMPTLGFVYECCYVVGKSVIETIRIYRQVRKAKQATLLQCLPHLPRCLWERLRLQVWGWWHGIEINLGDQP